MSAAEKTPLPTRNLARLVENLKAIAERRKLAQCQLETAEEDAQNPEPRTSDQEVQTRSFCEVTTTRYRGKLPSEVTLAELTAEFRAMSVTQMRQAERKERLKALGSDTQWRQLGREDAEFQSIIPSQMRSPYQGAVPHNPFTNQNVTPDIPFTNQIHSSPRQDAVTIASSTNQIRPEQDAATDDSRNAFQNALLRARQIASRIQQQQNQQSVQETPAAETAVYTGMLGVPVMCHPAVSSQTTHTSWAALASQNRHTPATAAAMQQQRAEVDFTAEKKSNWASMAAPSPMEQKQILGERLFPQIRRLYPDLAGKITGMLLEIDNADLLHMLQSQQLLKIKVEEAVAVLQAHEVKKKHVAEEQSGVSSQRPGRENCTDQRPLTGDLLKDQDDERIGKRVAVLIPGPEPLTAAMLARVPPQEQKQMLGERLFPQIRRLYPVLAGKITGILLEIDNEELLHMLNSQQSLKIKVEEAVAVLQAHQAREKQAVAEKRSAVSRPKSKETEESDEGWLSGDQLSDQDQNQPSPHQPVTKAETTKEQDAVRSKTLNPEEILTGQKPLTADSLAELPPQHHKQMLGEHLYPLVNRLHPDEARKLTGMLLELDNATLLTLLQSQQLLEAKVQEAVAVLQAAQPRQNTEPAAASAAVHKRDGEEPKLTLPQKLIVPEQFLIERLFPLVASMYPDRALASCITGMLMKSDPSQIILMLQSRDFLVAKVTEVVTLLQARQAQEIAAAANSLQQALASDTCGRRISVPPSPELLTSDMLDAVASPQERRVMLQQRLFPLVQRLCPELAGKITEVLLQMDKTELLDLLQSQQLLKTKVEEVVAALQTDQGKETTISESASTTPKQGDEELTSPKPAEAVVMPKQEQITVATLAEASAQEQKQMWSERLFPLVAAIYPDRALASCITGMLVNLDQSQIILMLQCRNFLVAKVMEAVAVLQAHQAQEIAAEASSPQQAIVSDTCGHGTQDSSSPEPLTSDMLDDAASPQERRTMLQQRLFPLVQRIRPELAGKVTEVLLQMDNTELIELLQSQQLLKTKVEEVVAALQTDQDKETTTSESGTVTPEQDDKESTSQKPTKMVNRPEQEPLTAAMLGQASPQEQKQMWSERLFPLVAAMYPDRALASCITGMLVNLDQSQIVLMLRSRELLVARVNEAVAILRARQAQEQAVATVNSLQQAAVFNTPNGYVLMTPSPQPLKTDVLAAATSPWERNAVLYQRLFPLIHPMCPELAGEITEILLQMDNAQMILMLQSQQLLKAKVEEVVAMLQTHQARKTTAASAADDDDEEEKDAKEEEKEPTREKTSEMADVSEEKALSVDMLSDASPDYRKQVLRDHLYPLIAAMYPDQSLASGITTVVMTNVNNSQLICMLQSKELLVDRVMEAVTLLQQACQTAAQGAAAAMSSRQDHVDSDTAEDMVIAPSSESSTVDMLDAAATRQEGAAVEEVVAVLHTNEATETTDDAIAAAAIYKRDDEGTTTQKSTERTVMPEHDLLNAGLISETSPQRSQQVLSERLSTLIASLCPDAFQTSCITSMLVNMDDWQQSLIRQSKKVLLDRVTDYVATLQDDQTETEEAGEAAEQQEAASGSQTSRQEENSTDLTSLSVDPLVDLFPQ